VHLNCIFQRARTLALHKIQDFCMTNLDAEQLSKLAIEVNGETYHAEGIVPNEVFDDNLFRQNEILQDG